MVLDTYKPYISGVTLHVSMLKNELERMGHEVVVFTFGVNGDRYDEDHVMMSPGFRLPIGYCVGLGYPRAVIERMREMDVLHLHHPFLTGWMVGRYLGNQKPTIFTAHTRYDLLGYHYLPGVVRKAILSVLRWFFPRFTRRITKIVGVSPASLEGLRVFGVQKEMQIVPNGIDLQVFHKGKLTPEWRERMGGWPLLFVYTGRLAPEKNLPKMLEAFSRLARRFPQAGLALAGRGNIEADLHKMAARLGVEKRVKFLGFIPHNQLPDLLASADVFVMPSTADTHPLTVIEAMAVGLPVIVSQSAAYGGMILEGKNGVVTAPSIDGIAAGMEALAKDSALRLRIGSAGKETAEGYSIGMMAERILKAYSEAITTWNASRVS
jgi:glycosyltransferase involved in cell wall biosynthesis